MIDQPSHLRRSFLSTSFELLFWVLIVGYGLLMVVGANLGPIDDHFFLSGIQIGKYHPLMISMSLGRFFPLCAQELNIISRFTTSPAAYYAVNMTLFYILTFLLLDIIGTITSRRTGKCIILLLIFTPGFTSAWFRLHIADRNAFFFMVFFLYFYLQFNKRQTWTRLVLGLAMANISFYYKEPIFLMLGGFAFTHVVLEYRNSSLRARTFDSLLIMSAFIYATIYYVVIFRHTGQQLYGDNGVAFLQRFKFNLIQYMLCDPMLLVFCIPLAFWRWARILFRKGTANPLYDSLLLGAVVYMVSFIKINLFNPWYWLPAYAFATPALVYYIVGHGRGEAKFRFRKKLFGLATAIMVINSYPFGLHLLTFYKYLPTNYNRALDAIVADIQSRPFSERPVIYLDGLDKGNHNELYGSFKEYLIYKGLHEDRFFLPVPFESFIGNGDDTYLEPYFPKDSGDYLVLTPFGGKRQDSEYISGLYASFACVERTNSSFAIPFPARKDLIKAFFFKFGIYRSPPSPDQRLWVWPDYSVWRKK